jgi:hypothetical protein
MAIMYYCSDGSKLTEGTIKSKLSKAYREKYDGNYHPFCENCGKKATETSHIISKADAKILHKTELIWCHENMMASCRECHIKWENIYNPDWCKFSNIDRLLAVLVEYDIESYNKRIIIYEEYRRNLEKC